jgi:hypothetical protein
MTSSTSRIHTSLFVLLTTALSACGARVSAGDFGDGATGADAALARDADTRADAGGPPPPPAVVCAPGEWCWQAPLPQGHAMHAVFTVSAREAWAVGANGATQRWADGRWSAVAPVTDVHLTQVWGSGASDVWAWGSREVAGGSTRSELVRWDGTRWSVVPFGANPFVQSVSGSGPANVWLVTTGSSVSALQRWNGTAFVPAPALPDGARALSVCVRSETEAWVTAGDARNSFPVALYRWNGAAWSLAHRAAEGSGERFNSAVTCPANGVAVVSYFSFNDGVETYLEVRDGRVSGDMLPLARSPQLVRTPHNEAFFFNGAEAVQWTPMGWRRSFSGVTGSSFSHRFDLLPDGSAGWLANGTPWLSSWSAGAFRVDSAAVDRALNVFVSTSGANPTDPIAAFGDRVWARRDGARWVFAPTPTIANGTLLSVNDAWGADPSRAWLVGEANAIALYNANTQAITAANVANPGTDAFVDIDGSDAATVWAVGANATVRRLEGDRWVAPSAALPRTVDGLSLAALSLTAVDVASANDVMILGNDPFGGRFGSVFLRWNGAVWTATVTFGVTLERFARDGNGDVYVIEGNTVRKRPAAGGPWTDVGMFTGFPRRIRVYGPDEIELVASDGASTTLSVWDRDRRAFSVRGRAVQVSGIADIVAGNAVEGGASSYWALGAFGAVLRFEPAR